MIISPPPVNFFSIFGIRIYFYSVFILLALAVSVSVVFFISKRFNSPVSNDLIFDMLPYLVISSVISARLYYVLLSLDYFIKNPAVIFMVWKGGIAIHGVIAGGIIFSVLYLKIHKQKVFPYLDIFSAVFPLGQSVGRWGNFFNSEAFGLPIYDLKLFGRPLIPPVVLFVDERFRPDKYFDEEFFHPAFLYESILDFIIFVILIFVYKKTVNKYDGFVFFAFILSYSCIRFFLEFLRTDTVFYIFNCPFPVFISVISAVISLIGIRFVLVQSKNH